MKNCTYVRRVLLICMFAIAGMLEGFSQQIEKGLTSSTGDYLGFLEYKPTDYNPRAPKYPLIIFLHGIGERGNGTTMLKDVTCCGIPRIIKKGHNMKFNWNGKSEQFLVISPQCPEKYGMWPAVFVKELIAYAKKNLNVDPNRIYLTGLSMGGGGTFRYISTAEGDVSQISAAAPICTPCTFSNPKYATEANLPIWAFHAADDPTASVQCSYNAINRLNQTELNPKPQLTIWPTGGHIVWDRVYTDTSYRFDGVLNVYEWFLGQNKTLAVNKLPVARAGNTINITTGTATATLDGSASTDADGKLVRYVWRKLSGPTAGSITTAFGGNSSTTVTGLTVAGTYQYQLNVVDDRAGVSRDTLTVVVSNGNSVPNLAPVAKAGIDANIILPITIANLNGSASSDQDGTISSYLWTKVSGPAATIVTPNAATSTVIGLLQGTYVFKLKVTDNKGLSAEDQVTIVVNAAANDAPVAKAGTDITITLPTNTIALNGSTSTDADGTIASYQWTKVSGPAATIANASGASTAVNNLVEGTYVFKLKVTDNKGMSAEDQVTIVVNPAANVAPVAKAGTDINITLPTNTVALNGGTSTDADGTIASYQWTKVSGPAATIANASGASTAVNNLVEGTYIFKLKVTDNDGASSEDQVTVTVNPAANVAPVAKAGTDINITLPTNTVALNGSTSTDADGTIASYQWTKVSGPAAAIANASGASTAVNNLVEGTYVFKLKVTDNDGASSEDQVTVTVNPAANVAPVAKAGTDITITLPTNTIALNGSTSTDADGTIASYQWTKVSGPAATIANASGASTAVNNLVEGTYVFKLKVTDNDGASSEDQVTVTVNPKPNVAPVAKAGNDMAITLPTNTIELSGNGSTDSDGTIASYQWTKVSGPSAAIETASGANTNVNNLVEGVYVFRLKVTDNNGASSQDDVKVTVNPKPIVAPVAEAGTDITITLPVNTITLNGSTSSDEDGTIRTYLWTKLSGPAATIANPSDASTAVNNLVEGTYTFKLRVTDNDGAFGEDVVIVRVKAALNIAPVATAGNDISITLPVNRTSLSAISSSDADGSIVSYAWAKISGPPQFILADAGASFTSVTNLVEGTYTFRLVVTDNKGATDADTIVVKVNPAPPPPNVAPIAEADVNKTITLPVNSVDLNGSSSTDADGNITSYEWTFIGGPSTYQLTNATSATANVTSLEAGTYSFRLEVKDNDGATDADTITITVKEETAPPPPPNVVPVAKAGDDITITLPVNQVTLSGSESTDEDGTISSYVWTKISGPAALNVVSPKSVETIIENLVEGTYTFRLQVKDNDGALSSDTINVIVLPAPNERPASDAGTDITVQLPNPVIKLDGTDSYDPDGTVTGFKWEQVSGPSTAVITSRNDSITTITDVTEGEYVFRLTVTDEDGSKASDVVKITVTAADVPNRLPVIVAGEDIEITLPTDSVQLDGSNTRDLDGAIIEYKWQYVSGPTGANIVTPDADITTISGLVEGQYTFRLTVTDDDGDRASDAVIVTVHPAPIVDTPIIDPPVDTTVIVPPPVNAEPVADAGTDQTISFPDTTLTISGANSTDRDGTIAEYNWTVVEGPSTPTIVNPASPSTVINNLQTGEYTFVLTVTDNKGAVAKDTIRVSVINTQRFTEDFRVYPNPAVSNVNVQLTSDTLGMARITIYSATGNVVHVSNADKVQPTLLRNIQIGHLQTGLYYLEVIVGGKERKITKFIKRS